MLDTEDDMGELTRDEVKARAAVAGLEIDEAWFEMVRRLLSEGLAPLHRSDSHALRAVEPAATFDATGNEGAR